MRFVRNLAVCGGLTLALTGCAETIIAGLTISELLTAGSIVSSIVSGKGLGEHALDVATGQDCRILDAIFRKNRALCEPKNSVATEGDFKGLVALLDDNSSGLQIQLADIPMGENQYPKVNPVALKTAPKILADLTNRNLVPSSIARTKDDSKRFIHLTTATYRFNEKTASSRNVATTAPIPKADLRSRLTRELF